MALPPLEADAPTDPTANTNMKPTEESALIAGPVHTAAAVPIPLQVSIATDMGEAAFIADRPLMAVAVHTAHQADTNTKHYESRS